MSIISKEVFNDLMSEYFFLFQMDTGLIMNLSKNDLSSVRRGTSKKDFHFEFTVTKMTGQPLAKYIAYPNETKLNLVTDFGISQEDNIAIENFFSDFFTTARLKSLFA